MKKQIRLFAVCLLVLVAMCVASVALLIPAGAEVANEARIGTTEYATLELAVADAEDGATIEVLTSVELDGDGSAIGLAIVNKNLTIEGNHHTLTGRKNVIGRAIQITGSDDAENPAVVTFRNLTINVQYDGYNGPRCIDTRGGYLTLNLENVTLSARNEGGSNVAQTITVGGNHENTITINMEDCEIEAGTPAEGQNSSVKSGKGIVAFNPIKLTAKDTKFYGWSAVYLAPPNSSHGAAGSEVTLEGCEIISVNDHSKDPSNSFGAITVQVPDCSVEIEDTVVDVAARYEDFPAQVFVLLGKGNGYQAANAVVAISGDTVVTGVKDSEHLIWNTTVPAEGEDSTNITVAVSGGTFNVAVPDAYCANNFATVLGPDGTYVAKELSDGKEDALTVIADYKQALYTANRYSEAAAAQLENVYTAALAAIEDADGGDAVNAAIAAFKADADAVAPYTLDEYKDLKKAEMSAAKDALVALNCYEQASLDALMSYLTAANTAVNAADDYVAVETVVATYNTNITAVAFVPLSEVKADAVATIDQKKADLLFANRYSTSNKGQLENLYAVARAAVMTASAYSDIVDAVEGFLADADTVEALSLDTVKANAIAEMTATKTYLLYNNLYTDENAALINSYLESATAAVTAAATPAAVDAALAAYDANVKAVEAIDVNVAAKDKEAVLKLLDDAVAKLYEENRYNEANRIKLEKLYADAKAAILSSATITDANAVVSQFNTDAAAIETLSLSTLKENAEQTLRTVLANLLAKNNYSDANKEELEDLLEEALAKVNAATAPAQIDEAVAKYNASALVIETEEEERESAASGDKKKIDGGKIVLIVVIVVVLLAGAAVALFFFFKKKPIARKEKKEKAPKAKKEPAPKAKKTAKPAPAPKKAEPAELTDAQKAAIEADRRRAEKKAEKSAEEAPVEEVIEAPVEEAVEAPVEAVEAPVEEAVEAPVEEAVEAPAEAVEAAEAPVEKAPITEEKKALFESFAAIAPKTFAERLDKVDPEAKEFYEQIKNEILSYNKVKGRLSQKGESFRVGRTLLAKIAISGKTVKCYLALDPAAYDVKTYRHTDASARTAYADVPMLVRIRSKLSVKRTVQLIAELAAANGLEKK